MQCNSCHNEVPNDTVFCPSCGANLSKQREEATQTNAQLKKKLKEAEDEIEELQANLANRKPTPAGAIVAVVILSIACVITSILAVVNSNEAKSNEARLNDSLARENSCSQQMEALMPQGIAVEVAALRQNTIAGNDQDANIIYTDWITALVFDINVYHSEDFVDTGQTITVKVIKPDGSMMPDPGNSTDYSFSIPAAAGSYQDVTFGDGYTAGFFDERGTYVVVFFYNGETIATRTVWIN